MEFSISKMKEVIRSESDKRVSRDAATELGSEVEQYGNAIASVARDIAEDKGRVTVRDEDIKDALDAVEEDGYNER